MRTTIVPTLFCCLAVASGGCLSPRADPSAFYVLTPIQGTTNTAGQSGHSSLGVGPVTIPTYLNRVQMVTRVGTNQLDISDHDRWAESLERGVARTLARNLSVLLGLADVKVHPWVHDDMPDRQVVVRVSKFERDSSGTATLECVWELISTSNGERLAGREVSYTEPAAETGAAGSVAAMSRTLETLSRDIARAAQ